jgi:hypothetical protein
LGEIILVFTLYRLVTLCAAWLLRQLARLTLTHPMFFPSMGNRTAPSFWA